MVKISIIQLINSRPFASLEALNHTEVYVRP